MLSVLADIEPARGVFPFLRDNWLLILPPVLGFAGIYLLLPQARQLKPIWGGVLTAVAIILGAFVFTHTETPVVESLLFYAFSAVGLIFALLMLTQNNPVHAALAFALVVLSTCGLFLLQAAPFLMAATIIVYAGAIVVTFLFVIMLAQQEGYSSADQRCREPFLACLAGCILMASLLCIVEKTYNTTELDHIIRDLQQLSDAKDLDEVKRVLGDGGVKARTPKLIDDLNKVFAADRENPPPEEARIHILIGHLQSGWNQMKIELIKTKAKLLLDAAEAKRTAYASLRLYDVPGKSKPAGKMVPSHFEPGKLPAKNVEALGGTLFTDYLVPVVLAGVLLLVATIGAIVIVARRSEELR